MIKKVICVIAVAACLVLAGCATSDAQASGKPVVYTSFYPIHNLVEQIAGDTVDVRSFMPGDKDPHMWEPTPKNMKELAGADVLIVNGANMERWLDQVSQALPDLKILVLSDSVELITYKGAAAMGDFQYMASLQLAKSTYKIEFGHTHEDVMRVGFFNNKDNLEGTDLINKGKEIMDNKGAIVGQRRTFDATSGTCFTLEMGHESGEISFKIDEPGNWVFFSDRASEQLLSYTLVDSQGDELDATSLMDGSSSGFDKVTYDPHSWISLVNAKAYCNAIQNQLIELYPGNQSVYKKNKRVMVDQLTDLQSDYHEKFKDVRTKEFVVTHNAYAYLCRDFDLRQFPLQGLTTTESPSLKTMRKAINFCDYYQINTIFYEYGAEKKGADTLAAEINGSAVPLASMEYVTSTQQDKRNAYIDLMKMNLENLYTAMK